MTRLRIGIDIDGVLANTDSSWAAYMKSQHDVCGTHPEDFDYSAAPGTWEWFSNVCEKCFHTCLHDRDQVMNIPIKFGALEAVKNLSSFADLYVITSRPDEVHQHTIAWLQKVGVYPFIKEVIFEHDKATRCTALDIHFMIDDAPRHIEAIANNQAGTHIIAFDHTYNQHVKAPLRFGYWLLITEFLKAYHTVFKAYGMLE